MRYDRLPKLLRKKSIRKKGGRAILSFVNINTRSDHFRWAHYADPSFFSPIGAERVTEKYVWTREGANKSYVLGSPGRAYPYFPSVYVHVHGFLASDIRFALLSYILFSLCDLLRGHFRWTPRDSFLRIENE